MAPIGRTVSRAPGEATPAQEPVNSGRQLRSASRATSVRPSGSVEPFMGTTRARVGQGGHSYGRVPTTAISQVDTFRASNDFSSSMYQEVNEQSVSIDEGPIRSRGFQSIAEEEIEHRTRPRPSYAHAPQSHSEPHNAATTATDKSFANAREAGLINNLQAEPIGRHDHGVAIPRALANRLHRACIAFIGWVCNLCDFVFNNTKLWAAVKVIFLMTALLLFAPFAAQVIRQPLVRAGNAISSTVAHQAHGLKNLFDGKVVSVLTETRHPTDSPPVVQPAVDDQATVFPIGQQVKFNAGSLVKLQSVIEQLLVRLNVYETRIGYLEAHNPVLPMNFANTNIGATVIPELTSPTLTHETGIRGFISNNLFWSSGHLPAVTALLPWNEAGQCWCAANSAEGDGQAQIGIRSPKIIRANAVTIEHIAKASVMDWTTAPRRLEVWAKFETGFDFDVKFMGCQSASPGPEWFCLGEVSYDIDAVSGIQTLSLGNANIPASDFIVRVTGNYGKAYTCLYRVQLHGDLAV